MFQIYKEGFENNESSAGPSYNKARSKLTKRTRDSIDKIKGDLSLPDQGSLDAEYMLYYLGVAPMPDFFDEVRQNFEKKPHRLKIRISGANDLENWLPAAAARYLMDMSLGMKNGLIEFATISGDPLFISVEQFQNIREMELFSVKFKHQFLSVNIGGEKVRLSCNHKVKKNVKKEFETKVQLHPDFKQLLSSVEDSGLNVSTKTLIKYFCYKYYNLDSPSFRISNRRLQVLDQLYSRVQSKRSNSSKIAPKVSRAVKKNKAPVRKKQSVKVSSRSSVSKKSESVNSQPQNEFLFSDEFVENITPDDICEIQSKQEKTDDKLTLQEVIILSALTRRSPTFFNRLPKLLPPNFSYTTKHKRYNDNTSRWVATSRRNEVMEDWLFLSHLVAGVDGITNDSFSFKDFKTSKKVMIKFEDVKEATLIPGFRPRVVFFKCVDGKSYSFRFRPFGKLYRKGLKIKDKFKIPEANKKQLLIYRRLFGRLVAGGWRQNFIKLLRGNKTNVPLIHQTNFKVADAMANGLSKGNVESFLSYKYFGSIKDFMNKKFIESKWYDVLTRSINVMGNNSNLYNTYKPRLLKSERVTPELKTLVRTLKNQKGMIIEIGHKYCGPCKKISEFNSIDGKPFLFPIQFDNGPSEAVKSYLIREFNVSTQITQAGYPVIIRIDENGSTQY